MSATDELTAAAIEMEDSLENEEDQGRAPANEGGDEIVVPAPGPLSIYVVSGDDAVEEYLVVGWNSSGSPIIVGDNGGLRLLTDSEYVRDLTW